MDRFLLRQRGIAGIHLNVCAIINKEKITDLLTPVVLLLVSNSC